MKRKRESIKKPISLAFVPILNNPEFIYLYLNLIEFTTLIQAPAYVCKSWAKTVDDIFKKRTLEQHYKEIRTWPIAQINDFLMNTDDEKEFSYNIPPSTNEVLKEIRPVLYKVFKYYAIFLEEIIDLSSKAVNNLVYTNLLNNPDFFKNGPINSDKNVILYQNYGRADSKLQFSYGVQSVEIIENIEWITSPSKKEISFLVDFSPIYDLTLDNSLTLLKIRDLLVNLLRIGVVVQCKRLKTPSSKFILRFARKVTLNWVKKKKLDCHQGQCYDTIENDWHTFLANVSIVAPYAPEEPQFRLFSSAESNEEAVEESEEN